LVHSVLERQLRKVGATPDVPVHVDQWPELLSRVSQAYDEADQVRTMLERSISISSREMRELNSRLAAERDRLSQTVVSMADGLCVLDKHGQVEIANPAAERLLGFELGGLAGKDFADVVSGGWPAEKERRGPLLQLRAAIRSGEPCRHDDARFMTRDRAWLPVSFALTPINAAPSDDGGVINFSDIRKRKAAAEALRESESTFRAIFESAGLGMVRLDLDGHIADCNRTLSEMLGRDRLSLVGQSIFAYMHSDEAVNAREGFEKNKLSEGGGTQVERRYARLDGSTIWAMQTVSFVRDRDRLPSFAIGVVENITARKHLELSLRQAQKLEAVGQLASGIAHEINTPVQFVSDSVHFARDAVAELLGVLARYRAFRVAAAASLPDLAVELVAAEEAADLDYVAEQLPKALDRALDGLQRVATLVLGMKAFAHPDQKDKSPADLNYAIRTTLTIARNEYKYVADVETEFGELPPIVCHIGELNQVFLNILVNAAHAIGDVVAGTEVKGRITVRTWREGDSVFVSFTDTGSGIPEAVRHRVFDPFFTTKEVGQGTGQGLAIARAVIVDKHEGELTFETEVGRGTTFVIRLPIEPHADGSAVA